VTNLFRDNRSATVRISWWVACVLLLGVTVGAAILRLYQLGQPLWTDELHTAWIASGPLSEVAWRAEMGNQSPLFYYAAWLVARMAGMSEVSMRMMSVASGVALVPVAWWLVSRWTGRPWAGLLAAALVAIDFDFLFYAQEARPYACVQIVAALHVAVFWRLLSRPTVALRLAWVLGAALLFYLHYTAALVVVAELVAYGIVRCVPRFAPAYRLRDASIDVAIVAALMLPAIGHLAAIFARRDNWVAFVDTALPTSLRNMTGVYLSLCRMGSVYVLLPAALVFAGLVVRRLVARPSKQASTPCVVAECQDRDVRACVHAWVLVLCWMIVPAVIAWLATYTDVARLFMLRYLIGSALASVVVAGMCCAMFRSRVAHIAAIVIVLAAALYTGEAARQLLAEGRIQSERYDDWRGAVAYVNDAGDRLPVLVAAGLIESDELRQPHDERLRKYCLFPVLSIYRLDRNAGETAPLPWTSPGRLSEASQNLVVEYGGAWVMIRGAPDYVREAVADLLASLGETERSVRVAEPHQFGTITVLRVDVTD